MPMCPPCLFHTWFSWFKMKTRIWGKSWQRGNKMWLCPTLFENYPKMSLALHVVNETILEWFSNTVIELRIPFLQSFQNPIISWGKYSKKCLGILDDVMVAKKASGGAASWEKTVKYSNEAEKSSMKKLMIWLHTSVCATRRSRLEIRGPLIHFTVLVLGYKKVSFFVITLRYL